MEEGHYLLPKVDFVFDLLFGDPRSVSLTIDFLKCLLNIPTEKLSGIDFVNPRLKQEYNDDKNGIIDINIKLKNDEIIHIELQVLQFHGMIHRILYYHSKLIFQQIGKGEKYNKIKKTISIIITNHSLIKDSNCYHLHYSYFDQKQMHIFTDLSEIHILELTKLPTEPDGTALWPWLKFISGENEEDFIMASRLNPVIEQARKRLEAISANKKVRKLSEAREKMIHDIISERLSARDEGREEGRKEIIEEYEKKWQL
jgi:predicted transposase/invertase (TIGR01784 family)